jgi:hypothetical protein
MDRYPREKYCSEGMLSPSFGTQHEPFHLNEVYAEDWIGLFRQPTQRIISAFHDGMHASGFAREAMATLHATCNGNLTCFAKYPGIAGCTARMLTGQHCAAASAAGVWDGGKSKLAEALESLKQMRFVGLTERWQDSVCLFHRMFGGRLSKAQMIDYHKGQQDTSMYDERELSGWRDEVDEQIYLAAQRRFEDLVREHVPAGDSICGDIFVQLDERSARSELLKCSCEVAKRECGHIGGNVDCGSCPARRLTLLDSHANETQVACDVNSGTCLVAGQSVSNPSNGKPLFSWKLN